MSMILHDNVRVREKKVEEGLELIIRHLDDSIPVWALMAKYIDMQMEAEQKARKYRQWDKNKKNTISWIERLVDKPLNDHRKFCIRRVFVPYLINVKGLSRVDASDRIKIWLDKCNIISGLNFDPKSKIDYALNNVGSYYPISRARLEQENNPLYLRLEREGVIY